MDAGSTDLARPATLAGTISTAAINGTDDSFRWVTILTGNGHAVDDVATEDDGSFSLEVAPGKYYLAADGYAFSSFDTSDVQTSGVDLIEEF